jgi:hypothetical protein
MYVAGAEGFEPPNTSTKNWCLTAWPRPNIINERQSDFTLYRACVQTSYLIRLAVKLFLVPLISLLFTLYYDYLH